MRSEVRLAEKGHVNSFGFPWTQDGHGGDDPQRALRADEQLLQVVPRVVLPQSGQAVQHSPICQHLCTHSSLSCPPLSTTTALLLVPLSSTHHLQTQDRPPQGAVAEQAKTPGVGGHVAPDVAAALGAQVQRHDVVPVLEVLRQALQDTASLARQNT